MPIDPSQVQWDEIVPANVKWDQPKQGPMSLYDRLAAAAYDDPGVVGSTLRSLTSGPLAKPTLGLLKGASDLAVGPGQLLAHGVGLGDAADKAVSSAEDRYQAARGDTGFDAWRMAGNTIPALPLASGAAAAKLLPSLVRAGGTGMAFGTAAPVTEQGADFATEKAKQAGFGLVGGMLGQGVASGLARIVRPETSAAAKALMDEGVTLTPGKVLGGGFARMEDAATSIPVLGDFIKDAQRRSFGDFNRAAYGRALGPIGEDASKLPAGPQGVLAVKNALGDAYDKLLPTLQFKADPGFIQGLSVVRSGSALPTKELATFDEVLKKNLAQLGPNGSADGATYKAIESSLVSEAKKFTGSTDAYQKKLGDALNESVSVLRDTLARSNPQAATELQAINQGYANYARIRGAAASAGDKSVGFTPAQLASAVRSMDKSAGKGQTATGQALMQDLSDAGRTVLPSTVPDSGTPLRHAVGAGVAAMAGHNFIPDAAKGYVIPALAAGGMMTLPYTAAGQKIAQALLAKRPQGAAAIADALRRAGPFLGASALPALEQ